MSLFLTIDAIFLCFQPIWVLKGSDIFSELFVFGSYQPHLLTVVLTASQLGKILLIIPEMEAQSGW